MSYQSTHSVRPKDSLADVRFSSSYIYDINKANKKKNNKRASQNQIHWLGLSKFKISWRISRELLDTREGRQKRKKEEEEEHITYIRVEYDAPILNGSMNLKGHMKIHKISIILYLI